MLFRFFQISVPLRIFGSKREREEIIGWRYFQGTATDCCENANGTSVSIISKEFLDQLSDSLLANKDPHPCN
jgi:hypothetical protein